MMMRVFNITLGDNSLVVKSLIQASDRRGDNQSVITCEVDNTFGTCVCLFRGSEHDKYKTNLSGDTRLVINPRIRPGISLWATLMALPSR